MLVARQLACSHLLCLSGRGRRSRCSLPIHMRDEGSHFRIWDRLCSSDIQFVLCGERKVIGAVDPIPLRERTTLNVDGISLCRIVDRVGAPKGDYLSDWLPLDWYLPLDG
jgi:hypothetical protein